MKFQKPKIKLNTGAEQITIRKSSIPFVSNFIIINLSIILIFVILTIAIIYNPFDLEIVSSSVAVIIIVICFLCFEAYIIISSLFSWKYNLYVVSHDSITEKFGFIFKTQRTYLIRNIMEIRLSQGLLGRIFHFGTVYITTQLKEKKIILKNILNPEKSISILKQIATKNKEPVAFIETRI